MKKILKIKIDTKLKTQTKKIIKESQKEHSLGNLKSYKGTKELFKGLAI